MQPLGAGGAVVMLSYTAWPFSDNTPLNESGVLISHDTCRMKLARKKSPLPIDKSVLHNVFALSRLGGNPLDFRGLS